MVVVPVKVGEMLKTALPAAPVGSLILFQRFDEVNVARSDIVGCVQVGAAFRVNVETQVLAPQAPTPEYALACWASVTVPEILLKAGCVQVGAALALSVDAHWFAPQAPTPE